MKGARSDRIWRHLALCLLLALPGFGRASDVELTAYTEEWPPYNFEQDGKVRGIAADLLRAACVRAGLTCAIEMVPWARAYHLARHEPNTIVYTTARKPEREDEFVWIGPIMNRITWLYGHPGSEKKVRELKDLTTTRVGIVRGEASQRDLEAAGVPANSLVFEADNASVLRQFARHTIDVMVDTEAGMAWNLRSAGLPAATVTRLMKLSEEGAYYFAANVKSDPERMRRLQHAIDALRREGKLDAIAREYGTRKL